jgi:serine protease inhibitor
VKEYDMVNNRIRAVAEINGIVADHTNNKILDLLSSDAINSNKKMILINAVYFKGDYQKLYVC